MDSFVSHAINEAKKSPMYTRYGAILLYRNKVVSLGFNDYSGPIRRIQHSCFL